jgi:hypothetical protein
MVKGQLPNGKEVMGSEVEGGEDMVIRKRFSILLIAFLIVGCAGVLHDNLKIPAGKIAGDQFTGMRYPFKASAPPNWKMTTEFPDFLGKLGYDKPSPYDKEVTELYIFNPSTESNFQIDFTPANRGVRFSQESIEQLTAAGTESLKSELESAYGKGTVKVEVGPTEPISLKGVQFAARKYVTYTLSGVKREQGWIYGFSEPYQIFILYMILEKEGAHDRQDMKTILDSFEVTSEK